MISGQQGDLRMVMSGDYLPVAFVGSGVSHNYPDWTSFIELLAQQAGNQLGARLIGERGSLDLETLLLIADDAQEDLGPAALRDYVRSTFAPRGSVPSVFDAIVRAPFAFYITTNYDGNIEDAFQKNRGESLPVVTPERIEDALVMMRDSRPFVLKIHGCARSGSQYVIGLEDYRVTLFDSRHLRYVLASILATRPVVFIGYGHRDPHITRYLDYERTVLPRGAMRRFTFIRRGDEHLAIGAYLKRLYVSRVEVDEWTDVEDILDQCTFLRLRDRYQRGRQEFFRDYVEFVDNGKIDCAWGALMYATAASDLGHAADVGRIRDCVENNEVIRKRIGGAPALEIALCIVLGQLEKRAANAKRAATYFERAESLARSGERVVQSLRALALRYAGIFYLRPGSFEDTYKDVRRAKRLLDAATDVLDEDCPEELLDVKKWQAVLLSEEQGPARAAEALFNVAAEADKIGSRKTGAWCRYGGVEQLLRLEAGDREQEARVDSELEAALAVFEELQHPRGLGATHHLLASAKARRATEDVRLTQQIEHHLQAAQAMAMIAGDSRLQQRCRILIDRGTGSA